MITLITGGPGLGKTALAVSMLLKQYADRPIFTNIRGLTLDHSPLPKLEEWTREEANQQGTSEFHFTFPPGAVVVIDECQQFFRPRASGSKVPPYVSAFETHRHRGIDFILITQGSRLVDSNLRSLVKGGLHIFLKTSYVGRFRYEKSEVIDEDSKASYSMAARRKYKLPKEAFSLYKSSELHTKPPRSKLPMAAYVLIGAVVVGGALAYKASEKIGGALAAEKKQSEPQLDAPAGAQRPTSAAEIVASVPSRIIEAMTPTDDNNPLSAPLYAPVAPPVVPPEIVGCIASARACTCYSQQETPVWVPPEQCRKRAAGLYYDPYRNPPPLESQTKQADAPSSGNEATAPEGGLSRAPEGPVPPQSNPPPAGEALT